MSDSFEWDERKNRLNWRKHGISFERAVKIFEGPVFTAVDNRRDYGEIRHVSIGTLPKEPVVVVVHTDRFGRARIISARRASRMEREAFYEHLKKEIEN